MFAAVVFHTQRSTGRIVLYPTGIHSIINSSMAMLILRFVVLGAATHLCLAASVESVFHKVLPVRCRMQKTYYPSSLEHKWRTQIDAVADKSREWAAACALLRTDEAKVRRLVELWDKYQSEEQWRTVGDWRAEGILSYFEVKQDCEGEMVAEFIPIEPLISMLRHPLYHCFGLPKKQYVVNKNYMFQYFHSEILPRFRMDGAFSYGRSYLFDLGASTYNAGFGGASESWFVDVYRARGIDFNRIFAWEATTYNPSKLFSEFPDDVIDKVSYFNIPASTNLSAGQNPLNILKKVARADDFVVFKLDIDHVIVEGEFIQQILDDPDIYNLIDELYFEHHVENNVLEHHGWGRQRKPMNITQSYHLFTTLRELGIRAHSWV